MLHPFCKYFFLEEFVKAFIFLLQKRCLFGVLLQVLVCFILIDQIYNKSLFSGFSFFFWHFIQNVDIQDSLGKTWISLAENSNIGFKVGKWITCYCILYVRNPFYILVWVSTNVSFGHVRCFTTRKKNWKRKIINK